MWVFLLGGQVEFVGVVFFGGKVTVFGIASN